MKDICTVQDALKWGFETLKDKQVNNPKLSTEILLSECLSVSRISLYSKFDYILNDTEKETFVRFVNRRSNHEPVQYILGYTYFHDLKIFTEPGVLIPRPETECLVECCLNLFSNNNNNNVLIADICCGSGCISLSLAHKLLNSKIYATDISKKACDCTIRNVKHYSFQDRINVINCNLADKLIENKNLLGKFDLIVSNPPYIPSKIIPTLDKEIIKYEDIVALDGGESGLDFIFGILEFAKSFLAKKGYLVLELHETNLQEAAKISVNYGFKSSKIIKDLSSKDRVLILNNTF